MTLDFFDALEAIEFGAGLADEFASKTKSRSAGVYRRRYLTGPTSGQTATTFYKKAKLANSFKWRTFESGFNREVADQLTEQLLSTCP